MPQLTIENCKAPTWEDFPKLAKMRADSVFEEARRIKEKIAELQDELQKATARIQAKLETGIDDPTVKSIRYENMLISKIAASERRSLDKRWAKTMLLRKGVKEAEIAKHEKVSTIEEHVSIRLLGEETDEE